MKQLNSYSLDDQASENTEVHLSSNPSHVSPPFSPWKFSTVSLILVVLVAAGAGFAWIIRKRRPSTKRPYLIEQVSSLSLGPKTNLSVVKVGGDFVLLGVTPHAVTTLSVLPHLTSQYEKESDLERSTFHAALRSQISTSPKTVPNLTEKTKEVAW